tara:strand:+ start:1229 stop:1429 length:201 start_codon:yes stop_codon:yes gene_type:complete
MKKTNGPLRLFGTLLQDFFRLGKKTDPQFGWCRYPLSVKNKTEQSKILRIITKSIRENQKIENENN